MKPPEIGATQQEVADSISKELESIKDLDYSSQLHLLRSFSKQFGVLHEAQVIQLRYWPYAVDPDLPAEGGAEVNLMMEDEKIKYIWTDAKRTKKWKPDKKYRERLEHLAKWTKWMLGENFSVRIELNGKKLYPK